MVFIGSRIIKSLFCFLQTEEYCLHNQLFNNVNLTTKEHAHKYHLNAGQLDLGLRHLGNALI